MELYAMDQIEGFSDTFDLEKFKRWRNQYIGYMLYKKDIFCTDILMEMKKRKKKIPLSSRIFWKYYSFITDQLRKVYHKFKAN